MALPEHLPLEPNRLVGRVDELAAVRALLLDDRTRLLTLTGPAGVGKSRLAVAAGAESGVAFRDGAWFVDLAPVSDPGLVMSEIAQTLGVRGTEEQAPAARIARHLAERPILLILDNLEHLLDSVTDLVPFLSRAPAAKLLVTSREPLHHKLEQVLPLKPLAVPSLSTLPSIGDMMRIPAVELFVERARAVQPDFALTESNRCAVAELCVRLDGLPLAIELAAARMGVLSASGALERLVHRFALLRLPGVDTPPRHRSMEAAIDWSYGLLGPAAQATFRRLSVFRGGFTLDAVEAVVDSAALEVDVLETMSSLVAKALVQTSLDASGEPRFSLLETLREFAFERLSASHEREACERSHAAHYGRLAETAAAALEGPDQRAWFARLRDEHDNLRAALEWAAGRGEASAELRLAGSLAYFWSASGHAREGLSRLDAALERATDEPEAARLIALKGAALLASYLGRDQVAASRLEQALDLARASRNRAGVARVLALVIVETYLRGQPGRWRTLAADFDRSCRGGEVSGLRFAPQALAMMAHEAGEDAAAAARLNAMAAACRRSGDRSGEASARACLALFAQSRSDRAGALVLATEALQLALETGHLVVMAWCAHVAVRLAADVAPASLLAPLVGAASAMGAAASLRVSPQQGERYDRIVASVRATLGESAFASGAEEGRALTADQFVAAASLALASAPVRAPTPVAEAPEVASAPAILSPREREVFQLVAQGCSNRAIADVLVISRNTAKFHLMAILRKLGARTRAQAVARGAEYGLLRPTQTRSDLDSIRVVVDPLTVD